MGPRRDHLAPPASPSPSSLASWEGEAPACTVCGRADATLRVVSYPVVVSMLIVTFQRSFTGLWCRRDRSPWAVLAGVISAVVGWIGIPFGFIRTPAALLRVAQGGVRPVDANASLLNTMAEHKLRQGDVQEAIRCLEASLRFRDDPAVRERLRGLYMTHAKSAPIPFYGQALAVAGALLAALAVGLGAGYLDHLIGVRLYDLPPWEASVYVGILSWTPKVALAFVGALALRPLVEWALARMRCRQRAPAVGLGLFAAALMIHGFLGGQTAYYYIDMLRFGVTPLSFGEGVRATAAVLLRGGTLTLVNMAGASGARAIIDGLLIVAAAACYVAVGVGAARHTADWQKRLAAVRTEAGVLDEAAPLAGWASLGSAALGFVLLLSLNPQQSIVDYVEATHLAFDAQMSLEAGHTNAAFASLQDVVRLRPGWAPGHLLLGVICRAQGELDWAVAELEAAVRGDPQWALAHSELAVAYADQHRFDEALREHQAALSLDESAVAYEALASTHYEQQDYGRAVEACRRAIALDPQLVSAHLRLGLAYIVQGGADQALEEFRTAGELAPDLPIVRLYMGRVYSRQGQFPQAIAELEAAARVHATEGMAHAWLAGIYYEMDRPDLMEQEMQKALAEPVDAYTRCALASIYAGMHRFAEAEAEFKEGLALRPDNEDAWLCLAGVYAAQGKYEAALDICDQVLALHKDNVDVYVARARIYSDQGKQEAARDELLLALKLWPDNPAAHCDLSAVHRHMGEVGKAVAEAEEAVRLSPYSVSALTDLALAYEMQGQIEPALEAARRAAELSPKYDLPHYVLGLCLTAKGERAEAAAELEAFLKLYWERPHAGESKAKAEALLAQLRY